MTTQIRKNLNSDFGRIFWGATMAYSHLAVIQLKTDLEVPSSSMTGCILLSHLVLLIPNYFLCRTDSKQREVFSTVDRP